MNEASVNIPADGFLADSLGDLCSDEPWKWLFYIAAPVRDANDNVIAAISISGPSERMKRNLEANLAQVRQAAEKISASIRPWSD